MLDATKVKSGKVKSGNQTLDLTASAAPQVEVTAAASKQSYLVSVATGLLSEIGRVVRRASSPDAGRVALVSNRRVHKLYGAAAADALRLAGFAVHEILIGDGERFKSWRTAEMVLHKLAENRFERVDTVVALGGGVVGDLSGFVASVYLRGLNFVYVPTTLLAQVDASTGGKTGVNSRTGKNLFGAFHHPRAVLIDTNTITTLDKRDLLAGWCEAIKHGAVSYDDRKLFNQTVSYLQQRQNLVNKTLNENQKEELAQLIAAHVAFKAGIVAGDEREDPARTDAHSRRILNFGHTLAHALEAATLYRKFRHGEAVGYGMIAAAEISNRLGLLPADELSLLRSAIALAGRLPDARGIDESKVLQKISFDKKAVSGSIKWVLIKRLGDACIIDGREIDSSVIAASLHAALHNPISSIS